MEKPIKDYRKAAGGWDALFSSFKHVQEQGIVAKGAATMLKANQPNGFDCPGCAWPDRNGHSSFEFCENGVKAVAAEATSKRVDRALFQQYTVTELAAQTDYWLESHGRLTEPMRYDAASDKYQPIEWGTAFEEIGQCLQSLDDPDQAIFYTSGRTSNEAAFLYQLFIREFGTNNLPDCSNMCHEPSGVALVEQIGIGKGTVTLEDFELAKAIFIFGQNPGTNHPRMLGELRAASKRGCKIVAFNPLRERGLERFAHPQDPVEMMTGGSTRIASHYYQPRLGGDLAVAKGIAKLLLEWNAIDADFIAEHCSGFESLKKDLEAEAWSDIETAAGLTFKQIEEVSTIYRNSNASIICWGMGITQHKHAVGTIQMLTNLLLLKGNIGKPGAGACPVRGHSNVQGDRTMGIYEKPSKDFLDKLGQAFDFTPPKNHGYDVVEAIHAMLDRRGRFFLGMGGNFAAATPDTHRTAEALRSCEMTVQISTKLNRSHLIHGARAFILPCLGRTEVDLQASGPQAVSVEDSMSMVHCSTGMNAPASEHLLSEPAIVARIACEALPQSRTQWMWMIEDYDRIREKIAEVIEGFENFNARVRISGGFYLGNSARDRQWRTKNGRAGLYPHSLPLNGRQSVGDAPLTLMTIRSHDQYNTTIYGLEDRYRGISGTRMVCFISKSDLSKFGMRDGEWVDLISVWDDGERIVHGFRLVEYDIPEGCVAAYYPETNPLVPLDSFADRAKTPTSKSIPVRLQLSVAKEAA